MDDKLTRKSQEALSEAVKRAAAAGNPNVDALHLLVALIEQSGGTATPLLRAVGADPATIALRSRATIRFPRSDSGTSPATIRWASPSTTAVLPTPGSPISTGLFFVRRERICITRSISVWRPTTGSRDRKSVV